MEKITSTLEVALTVMRRLTLRFWRRRLVQEFLVWLRRKYDLSQTDHTKLANWNERLNKCEWLPDGKMKYSRRLETWLVLGSQDIIPGVDALERSLAANMRDQDSLNESWWE
jgi:hypothetical protein